MEFNGTLREAVDLKAPHASLIIIYFYRSVQYQSDNILRYSQLNGRACGIRVSVCACARASLGVGDHGKVTRDKVEAEARR
jgi:hypothetical protein